MKKVLTTQDLEIGYRNGTNKTTIAKNINLTFESGKLITLVGANGIGKSTLLRTLSGIQKAISGSVFLDEKSIQCYSSLELARKCSVVFTEALPPSNLTVYELIALGRQPYTNWIGTLTDLDRSKIHDAIEITELRHLAAKKHFELSDGQLQKVLIARALAQDTPLIILDEPTTHLDILHKATLFELLKSLTTSMGKTILFSTHDIDIAIQLSDMMLIMTSQKIILDTPTNLIEESAFDQIFPSNKIMFDKNQQKFVFRNL